MAVTLAAALDRSLIARSGPSERCLMLTISAGDSPAPRVPLRLALVVDASGSMSGEKLVRAKEAAGHAVRQLGSADQVAVIAYSDDVRVVAPSTSATASAKTDLLYRIGRIETGGMTNLSGGWLAGCQEVARPPEDDREQRNVLVLEDFTGQVSEGLNQRQVKELHYQSYLTRSSRRRYDPPKA